MLDKLTTPHPTCVQGATGEIGNVPEVGSHVDALGYHADKFSAGSLGTHTVTVEAQLSVHSGTLRFSELLESWEALQRLLGGEAPA